MYFLLSQLGNNVPGMIKKFTIKLNKKNKKFGTGIVSSRDINESSYGLRDA